MLSMAAPQACPLPSQWAQGHGPLGSPPGQYTIFIIGLTFTLPSRWQKHQNYFSLPQGDALPSQIPQLSTQPS